jgi:hypothetical protein
MSKLVPTTVVDRNGRATTVYKRPENKTKDFGNLFGVLPRSSEPSRSDLIGAVLEEIEELDESMFASTRKAFTGIKTEHLQGVLEILSRDDARLETVRSFDDRFQGSVNKNAYNDWVAEYSARYSEMKTWSCGHSTGASDDTMSKLIAESLHSRSRGTSPEVAEGVMRMTCALIGTGLTKQLAHHPTDYGLSFIEQDSYVADFVQRHPAPEDIERACILISSGKLNRIEDLDSVFEDAVPMSLIEGAL